MGRRSRNGLSIGIAPCHSLSQLLVTARHSRLPSCQKVIDTSGWGALHSYSRGIRSDEWEWMGAVHSEVLQLLHTLLTLSNLLVIEVRRSDYAFREPLGTPGEKVVVHDVVD